MLKAILNPGSYSKNLNFALLLLRVAIGVFMLTHGIGKLLLLFGGEPIIFPDPLGIGSTASLSLAVFAEVFCSVLLIFGIATRFAAIPLLATMSVAALIVHAADQFSNKEMSLIYLVVYIAIALAGAGKYSVDNWIYKNAIRQQSL